MVGLAARPTDATLIRRAAGIAASSRATMIGVHVRRDDPADGTARLEDQLALLEDVSSTYREVVGDDVAEALVAVARAEGATQLVLGASRRSRLRELVTGSTVSRVVRRCDHIDVHVIAAPRTASRSLLPRMPRFTAVSPRRRLVGLVLTAAGLPATTASLSHLPPEFGLPSILLLYLLLIVAVTVVGGAWTAVVAAVGGFLLANWYFTEPRHTLTIDQPPDAVALLVFLVVAAVVSTLVDLSARRSNEAARAKAESSTLARLTETLLDTDEPLGEIVRSLRGVFVQDAVAILRRREGVWEVEVAAGEAPPTNPAEATDTIRLDDGVVLALKGPRTPAGDRRILAAFAAQVAMAVTGERLKARAAEATALAQANDLRAALLAAVSHDLRTPLSSIKASVTSLLQRDVEWPADLTLGFLQAIDEETDRLDRLVGNLLDMSRLQAGAVQVQCRPTSLEEVVPAALASLGTVAADVAVDVPESLPQVVADPALLERVIANVVGNAVKHSPEGTAVTVTAAHRGGHVELRVIDRGPGVRSEDRERIFQPFQRVGDRGSGGVGLGLAVARGFVDAMGASLRLTDTPGGGLTMSISLKAAT